MGIDFNVPHLTGKEFKNIKEIFKKRKLSGDGEFTKRCSEIMEKKFGAKKVLLTTSCTHALDMAAILLDLKEGDEVIAPSYTFPSTINAFVLRGAKPVFVDIREDTLNMDEEAIEKKITKRTKAIFVMHYAGVGCHMDKIMKIAKKHKLYVIEDAAQGVNAKFKGKYLGTIGDMGAYSFHETKNYSCGEGGALVINNKKFIERAEIIREKGTNRSKFYRGEINKYGWVDIGSSFLPPEIVAACLQPQLEDMEKIQKKRKSIFERYMKNLKSLENKKYLRLPKIPAGCSPNYHMFYVIIKDAKTRSSLITFLKDNGIMAVFHYLPLHSSVCGKKICGKKISLPKTEGLSERILRLPFYFALSPKKQTYIISKIKEFFEKKNGK